MYYAYVGSISKLAIVVNISTIEKLCDKPLANNVNLSELIDFIPFSMRLLSKSNVQGYMLIDIYLDFPYDQKPAGLYSSTLHAINTRIVMPPDTIRGIITLISSYRSIKTHRKAIRFQAVVEVMLIDNIEKYKNYICLTGDTIEEVIEKARQQAKDVYPESYRIHVKCYQGGILIKERGFYEKPNSVINKRSS